MFKPKANTPISRNTTTLNEARTKLYRDEEKIIVGIEVWVTNRASKVPNICESLIQDEKLRNDT